jgi:hypothetical protein
MTYIFFWGVYFCLLNAAEFERALYFLDCGMTEKIKIAFMKKFK